jgi:hypothetical protein
MRNPHVQSFVCRSFFSLLWFHIIFFSPNSSSSGTVADYLILVHCAASLLKVTVQSSKLLNSARTTPSSTSLAPSLSQAGTSSSPTPIKIPWQVQQDLLVLLGSDHLHLTADHHHHGSF